MGPLPDQGGERRSVAANRACWRGLPSAHSRTGLHPTCLGQARDIPASGAIVDPDTTHLVPALEEDLAAIDVAGPLVVKPAIKEHFFYATHVKAWRADNRAELVAAFRRATEIMPSERSSCRK